MTEQKELTESKRPYQKPEIEEVRFENKDTVLDSCKGPNTLGPHRLARSARIPAASGAAPRGADVGGQAQTQRRRTEKEIIIK